MEVCPCEGQLVEEDHYRKIQGIGWGVEHSKEVREPFRMNLRKHIRNDGRTLLSRVRIII